MNYPPCVETARVGVTLTEGQRRLLPIERTGASGMRQVWMAAQRFQALCDEAGLNDLSIEEAEVLALRLGEQVARELAAASTTPAPLPERPLSRPVVYLGSHMPNWLERPGVPLFVSDTRLRKRKRLPRAACDWALDSGGFTELSKHGRWTVEPVDYVARVRRYRDEIGRMQWAAIQDWMVEPHIRAKTGLTVRDHQWLTVQNYEELLSLAPEIPWAPVLQGWDWEQHREHLELYTARGHDLWALPVVGIGSVCRRQNTREAALTIRRLSKLGLKLHGFGFKVTGLSECWDGLVSSDSLAWSYQARRNPPLPGHKHKSCANCWDFAKKWLDNLHHKLGRYTSQRGLFDRLEAA